MRGGREYRLSNVQTGQALGVALTEWVYVNRQTLAPQAIPKELAVDFDTPGAPTREYDPPAVEKNINAQFTTDRTVEWHEIDSLGHVNNAIYVDWLDEAVRSALGQLGWAVQELKDRGIHLRGEYYNLSYRRAALPGDAVTITTTIEGVSERLCAIRQVVSGADNSEILTSESVHGWRTNSGEPCAPPEGWAAALLSQTP